MSRDVSIWQMLLFPLTTCADVDTETMWKVKVE